MLVYQRVIITAITILQTGSNHPYCEPRIFVNPGRKKSGESPWIPQWQLAPRLVPPISNSLVDYHSSGVANNTHGYTISSTGFLSFSVQRGYIISYHISSWLYHIIYPLYYDYIILKKYLPQNGWSCNWPPIFLGFFGVSTTKASSSRQFRLLFWVVLAEGWRKATVDSHRPGRPSRSRKNGTNPGESLEKPWKT